MNAGIHTKQARCGHCLTACSRYCKQSQPRRLSIRLVRGALAGPPGAERHNTDTAPATGAPVDRHRRHLPSAIVSTVPSRPEYIGPMKGEAGGAMPSRRLELVPPDELKGALADGIRAQH